MKTPLIFAMMLGLILTGCGSKSDSTLSNDEIIAGQSEKTWQATREINADGDKDKLTKDEKKEKITFSRNGDVKMGNDMETMSGKWSYTGSTLTLQFTGKDITENFIVQELSKDKMIVKATDGSMLTLKPE